VAQAPALSVEVAAATMVKLAAHPETITVAAAAVVATRDATIATVTPVSSVDALQAFAAHSVRSHSLARTTSPAIWPGNTRIKNPRQRQSTLLDIEFCFCFPSPDSPSHTIKHMSFLSTDENILNCSGLPFSLETCDHVFDYYY
jgi:hypothetical protein